MLFQKNTTKLEPRWRGPFWIARYGRSHGTLFELEQLNKRKIWETFHGDQLKTFSLRTGYLVESSDPRKFPLEQTIQTVWTKNKKKVS